MDQDATCVEVDRKSIGDKIPPCLTPAKIFNQHTGVCTRTLRLRFSMFADTACVTNVRIIIRDKTFC